MSVNVARASVDMANVESCTALEQARNLLNSLANERYYRSNKSLQTAATDAMLSITRIVWELRLARGEHGPGEKGIDKTRVARLGYDGEGGIWARKKSVSR